MGGTDADVSWHCFVGKDGRRTTSEWRGCGVERV
jgi:hypothetical protein